MSLDELRKKIDSIDDKLVELINEDDRKMTYTVRRTTHPVELDGNWYWMNQSVGSVISCSIIFGRE